MVKEDGAVLVHADAGGYKPLNSGLSMGGHRLPARTICRDRPEARADLPMCMCIRAFGFRRHNDVVVMHGPRSGERTLA
jgi:hypothetical protein